MRDERADHTLEEPRRLFVISGPSGVGKSTLAARLAQRGLAVRAVTATTRPPRPGERDGCDYCFVAPEAFRRWVDEGRLLEHTQYVGDYYGTPAAAVNEAAESGLPVMLTIDVDGGRQIKERWPEVTLIFLDAPSDRELRRRIEERGPMAPEAVRQRLERARAERKCAEHYDFRVVNDKLDETVDEIAAIMDRRLGNRD